MEQNKQKVKSNVSSVFYHNPHTWTCKIAFIQVDIVDFLQHFTAIYVRSVTAYVFIWNSHGGENTKAICNLDWKLSVFKSADLPFGLAGWLKIIRVCIKLNTYWHILRTEVKTYWWGQSL